MYNDLQGKSVVIAGAGAGIGRAAALAFGRAGARVMVSDMNGERGEATLAGIPTPSAILGWVRTVLRKLCVKAIQ